MSSFQHCRYQNFIAQKPQCSLANTNFIQFVSRLGRNSIWISSSHPPIIPVNTSNVTKLRRAFLPSTLFHGPELTPDLPSKKVSLTVGRSMQECVNLFQRRRWHVLTYRNQKPPTSLKSQRLMRIHKGICVRNKRTKSQKYAYNKMTEAEQKVFET
jgi:hypothetical protein